MANERDAAAGAQRDSDGGCAPGRGSAGVPDPYRQLGPLVGGDLLGGTVYEFDPGERSGPYHYEIGNEECLLVLAGSPTRRHPEGRDVLAVGDMIVFTDGPDGAHQRIDESQASVEC